VDAFRTPPAAARVSFGAWLALPAGALAAPGANDAFANATAASSLPFSDSGDLNGTTTEAGEPQICNFMQQTVWYSYTPSTSQALRVDLNGSDFGVWVALAGREPALVSADPPSCRWTRGRRISSRPAPSAPGRRISN
jgi:hypothetical protein